MNSGSQTQNISGQGHPVSISIQPGFALPDKADSCPQHSSKAFCFHHIPCFCSSAKAACAFSDFNLLTCFHGFLCRNVALQMRHLDGNNLFLLFWSDASAISYFEYLSGILFSKEKKQNTKKEKKRKSCTKWVPKSVFVFLSNSTPLYLPACLSSCFWMVCIVFCFLTGLIWGAFICDDFMCADPVVLCSGEFPLALTWAYTEHKLRIYWLMRFNSKNTD